MYEIADFNKFYADSFIEGVKCKWNSKPINCTLNQRAIRTIIKNILQNSLEGINKGNKKINLILELNNDKIKLEIKDNGYGMNGDVLRKCREPFYTTRINGLGLGLSIVENMMMILDGKMEIISQEKTGTVTKLSFNRNFKG